MDYHLYFSCSGDELEAYLDDLENRADRFLEKNPQYGYDTEDSCIVPGRPDEAAAFEASGAELDDATLERVAASASVFEWRNQPEWHKDPMSLSLLVDMLESRKVTVVAIDGAEYETPDSLLEHFKRKRLEFFKLPSQ